MLASKKSKIALCFFFFFFILILGCATSSYQVLFLNGRAAELSVSPDRVLLECEHLHDADIEGLYGFMIHVLDGNNDVVTVVQGNTLDKGSCEKRIHYIGRILREGKKIYIAGRGDLTRGKEDTRPLYHFPGKGSFKDGGMTLGFAAIANEKGLCFDAYGGIEEKPCPPEPFPFWNKK